MTPWRGGSPCSDPTCRRLVQGGGRCARHRAEADRELKARQPWRDYGRDWLRIRARVLAEEPRCRTCGALSAEVDHISPRRVELAAGRNPERRENLQALCRSHHSSKTAREARLGGLGVG